MLQRCIPTRLKLLAPTRLDVHVTALMRPRSIDLLASRHHLLPPSTVQSVGRKLWPARLEALQTQLAVRHFPGQLRHSVSSRLVLLLKARAEDPPTSLVSLISLERGRRLNEKGPCLCALFSNARPIGPVPFFAPRTPRD